MIIRPYTYTTKKRRSEWISFFCVIFGLFRSLLYSLKLETRYYCLKVTGTW